MSLKNSHKRGAVWQFQEAKARLSEVFDLAECEGPQQITRRGHKTMLLIDAEEYIRLRQQTTTLADVFRRAPSEFPYTRDERPVIPIDLE